VSFWKNFGKIALKVAPYAAMAIPGVGIPLGMALQGGLSALDTKVSGGSWKDALISGGIGAGTGAVAGGALKGISPSSGVAAKLLGGAGGVANTGKVGMLGKALGDVGRTAAENQLSKVGTPQTPQGPMVAPTPPVTQEASNRAVNMFQPTSSSLGDSIFAGRQNARRKSIFA
jgi:hypothetical protein